MSFVDRFSGISWTEIRGQEFRGQEFVDRSFVGFWSFVDGQERTLWEQMSAKART